MQAIQDSSSLGAAILLTVVREFVGTAKAAGYEVVEDGTVPDSARLHLINRARWMWLVEFPQLKALQTEVREKLNAAAEAYLQAITAGKQSVESPTATTSAAGSWNSANKILPRTHPQPRPGPQGADAYANPAAAQDKQAS